MLLLTRNIGQSIIINKNIKVTVTGVIGNNVRLGIQAPDEIPIHREEIQRRIDQGGDGKCLLKNS